MDFDIEATRRNLIALRVKHGADTPIGHRCSNLIERLKNYETATGDQRANLTMLIRKALPQTGHVALADWAQELIGNQ